MDEASGITVTGSASVSAPPDIARLQIGVISTRKDAAIARDAAALSMNALLGALKAGGVSDRDLRTTHIAVSEEYGYVDGKRGPRRFRAQNQVSATIRDLDTVGGVLDAAISAAGDDVILQGISFEIEDPRELERSVLAAAYEDAYDRARVLAASADLSLGPVLRIVEENARRQPFPARAAMMADSASTPVIPGDQEITAHLVVTWSLA